MPHSPKQRAVRHVALRKASFDACDGAHRNRDRRRHCARSGECGRGGGRREFDAIVTWCGNPTQPDRLRSRGRVRLQRHARLGPRQSVRLAIHRAGKLMQKGICKAFNGRMRDELLNKTVFYNLNHARAALDRRIKRQRPHSAISPRGFCRSLHRIGRSAAQP